MCAIVISNKPFKPRAEAAKEMNGRIKWEDTMKIIFTNIGVLVYLSPAIAAQGPSKCLPLFFPIHKDFSLHHTISRFFQHHQITCKQRKIKKTFFFNFACTLLFSFSTPKQTKMHSFATLLCAFQLICIA